MQYPRVGKRAPDSRWPPYLVTPSVSEGKQYRATLDTDRTCRARWTNRRLFHSKTLLCVVGNIAWCLIIGSLHRAHQRNALALSRTGSSSRRTCRPTDCHYEIEPRQPTFNTVFESAGTPPPLVGTTSCTAITVKYVGTPSTSSAVVKTPTRLDVNQIIGRCIWLALLQGSTVLSFGCEGWACVGRLERSCSRSKT